MNKHNLYESIGQIDDDILERSEKNKLKRKRFFPMWARAAAAVLAIAVISGAVLHYNNNPFLVGAHVIEEASYPDSNSTNSLKQEAGYAEGLESFFSASIKEFLSESADDNLVFSPLNIYIAMGMLAELTDGNSRGQILDSLGANSIEELREQASSVWKAHYKNDEDNASILASSLWLNENVSFIPSTMETLAKNYYASSYRGEMGSEKFNKALRNWINEQTDGLLENQTQDLKMDRSTVLALVATIYFKSAWGEEFKENKTYEETFYAESGTILCDFMHGSDTCAYYKGNNFSAVGIRLANIDDIMWFLLPNDGVEVQKLFEDSQAMDVILSKTNINDRLHASVNLSIPKFDVSSHMDLRKSLKALGISDVFDASVSDFSPMTNDFNGISISQARHDARVTIDEEGVTGAAYTEMDMRNLGVDYSEIDFILNRPFIFAVTSDDGLPKFVGVVRQPN